MILQAQLQPLQGLTLFPLLLCDVLLALRQAALAHVERMLALGDALLPNLLPLESADPLGEVLLARTQLLFRLGEVFLARTQLLLRLLQMRSANGGRLLPYLEALLRELQPVLLLPVPLRNRCLGRRDRPLPRGQPGLHCGKALLPLADARLELPLCGLMMCPHLGLRLRLLFQPELEHHEVLRPLLVRAARICDFLLPELERPLALCLALLPVT
mmetsp:Transcript_61100/g.192167  ORF Transcript_61100/g.192167 Transcript_61100/m.192167 type:complete len:215 (-) Transcript_61100:375-1019(-)